MSLCGLIQQFERLAGELLLAVRDENEATVDDIDSELQVLMRRIFDLPAGNAGEASAQIDFFKRLAQKECEDAGAVRRYTDMMSLLFSRYNDAGPGWVSAGAGQMPTALAEGYDPSLHELLLDSLPERVAVIGLDYRYLYCNRRNADFHGRQPSDFTGHHLAEFIDAERFEGRSKPRLDQCFRGARVFYKYEAADSAGRMFEVECRMTPLSGPQGTIAGAVIMLSMQPMFARAV